MSKTGSRVRGMLIGGIALAFVMIAILLATGRLPFGRSRQPSVVLISIDTVRPDHLGCCGYARATSPNLDRFASGAALFRNARGQAPWTLPSHMSLLTSSLPSHNRVEDLARGLAAGAPYLPEILHGAGYQTAAFVNNGQMKPHWGFSRGFDEWREFEVDTPEGMAEHVTDRALQWLSGASRKPFFLFLHYYDAHDPYDPPSPYRERFGVTLTGPEARQLAWEYRHPGRAFPDPALLDSIRTAYDAEIAYMDAHVGRLLDAVPRDAMVVIFSDHGEAFKEHGWTLHGAELYEEEIRSVLMIREPGGAPGRRVDDPVMLLDVAPTILKGAGIPKPDAFEGVDLQPAMAGRPLPARLHFAETKRTLEGRILKTILAPPAKLIYSLLDDSLEFYELPDESRRLPEDRIPPAMRDAMRQWVDEEPFWLVHLKGAGRCELTAEFARGRVSVFVPVGLDLESEDVQLAADGSRLTWTCYPAGGIKRLFLQSDPPDAELLVSARAESGALETNVFWRATAGQWVREGRLASTRKTADPAAAFGRAPVQPGPAGIYVERCGTRRATQRAANTVQLDDKTMRQLRSLGYAR